MTVNETRPSSAWPPVDQERLREAMRTGGTPAAYRAFPGRSRGAVNSAIRRFCWNGPGFDSRTPFPRSASDVRAAIAALSVDTLAERLGPLLKRGGNYQVRHRAGVAEWPEDLRIQEHAAPIIGDAE